MLGTDAVQLDIGVRVNKISTQMQRARTADLGVSMREMMRLGPRQKLHITQRAPVSDCCNGSQYASDNGIGTFAIIQVCILFATWQLWCSCGSVTYDAAKGYEESYA